MAGKPVDLGIQATQHIERVQIELDEDKNDLAAALRQNDSAAMREGLIHVNEISDCLQQLHEILVNR